MQSKNVISNVSKNKIRLYPKSNIYTYGYLIIYSFKLI